MQIINLNDYDMAVQSLKDLLEIAKQGRLRNFLVVFNYTDDRERLIGYCFSGLDHAVTLLGLAERLKHLIQKWMDEMDLDED